MTVRIINVTINCESGVTTTAAAAVAAVAAVATTTTTTTAAAVVVSIQATATTAKTVAATGTGLIAGRVFVIESITGIMWCVWFNNGIVETYSPCAGRRVRNIIHIFLLC